MKIVKPPVLKCKKCSTINTPSIEEFDGPEIESNERNMGYESEFTWQYTGNCERCNNAHEVTISAWEYPVGILNYQEIEHKGCTISEQPTLEVVFNEENFNPFEDEE